jgi:hypothetical protein
MKYVIECEGSVYGPFEPDADKSGQRGDERAAAWALDHCAGRNWRCRPLREPSGGHS